MNAIPLPTQEEEYFSIGSITEQVCNDNDLSIPHFFQKFLSWGLWGLVQLKMDSANCVKPILLPVSDVLTATLPPDCVDAPFVGLLYGQYVKELTRSDDLSKLDRTVANFNPSACLPPSWIPNGVAVSNYNQGNFMSYGGRALFPVGGGLPQRGHYTIIKRDTCKEILLDVHATDCTNTLYVEYIGLGIGSCNGDTIVGPYLAEYVRAYEQHEFEKSKRGPEKSEAAIERTGRWLWHTTMEAKGRTNAISPNDLMRSQRAAYRLTAKI